MVRNIKSAAAKRLCGLDLSFNATAINISPMRGVASTIFTVGWLLSAAHRANAVTLFDIYYLVGIIKDLRHPCAGLCLCTSPDY